MRKILALFLALILSNCATLDDKNLTNYDNTNPVKIEQSARGLEVNKVLPPPEEIDGTISIKSIELDMSNNLDIGVAYMIEDNLISNLIKNDYRVVERDPDILQVLHLESSNNYKKYKESNASHIIAAANTEGSETIININYAENDNNSENVEKQEEYSKTNLKASDYILSYRVLECGVIYNELDGAINLNNSSMLKIERSARTRLHVRLTDSKTSEIISADILENEVTDIVNKSDLIALQQIPYEYYHHTLPNKGLLLSSAGLSEDSGYKFNQESVKIEKPKINAPKIPTPLIVAGTAGFFFLMMIGD